MNIAWTAFLFFVTALAEIIGCYLPYLWLQKGKSPWLLVPAALSLAVFSWLLTLHPEAAGRTYAAYGGVYVTTALLWLWLIDGVKPGKLDYLGVALCLAGMAVIILGSRTAQPGN
jgi:small multidrug resistance family-3 protein